MRMEHSSPEFSSTLGNSEQHLRSILATVPDAMLVIDDKGIVLSFSAAAEKMFGYPASEVIGHNIKMLMPSPLREQHDGYLERYLTTGERRIIGIGRITTALHSEGYTFPIELAVGEAFMDGQRIFTGFIRDLTERQVAERRMHELQTELAHVGRVSEMGTLASSLAHELNQPLTAVANYCEAAKDLLSENAGSLRSALGMLEQPATARKLLSRNAETLDTVLEALDDAAKQAIRAGQIVRRLRDFLSHGENERHSEDLSKLIGEANALALVGSREHGIEVKVRFDAKHNHVFVDRIEIQQVLVNLIRNAVDATMTSPVRSITIRTSDDDSMVRVSVEDTGSGISEAIASQLFQPFVTSKEGGMGIGLSICRTIVEAHGGRIWFEPRKGGGTIFHFTVPTDGAEE